MTPVSWPRPNAEKMQGREGDVVLVNGILQPRIDARAGSVERWRIINASPSRYYRLATSGASMQQISSDQGRFDAPLAVSEIVLTPGQRAEVLVALNRTGTVTLSTTDVSRGSMGMGWGRHGWRDDGRQRQQQQLELRRRSGGPAHRRRSRPPIRPAR